MIETVEAKGCARCQQVEKTAKEVVTELGIDSKIEEVKDMKKIDYRIPHPHHSGTGD